MKEKNYYHRCTENSTFLFLKWPVKLICNTDLHALCTQIFIIRHKKTYLNIRLFSSRPLRRLLSIVLIVELQGYTQKKQGMYAFSFILIDNNICQYTACLLVTYQNKETLHVFKWDNLVLLKFPSFGYWWIFVTDNVWFP